MKWMIPNYEVAKAFCPVCGKEQKLSFTKGDVTRYTWCMKWQAPVLWQRVKEIESKQVEQNK